MASTTASAQQMTSTQQIAVTKNSETECSKKNRSYIIAIIVVCIITIVILIAFIMCSLIIRENNMTYDEINTYAALDDCTECPDKTDIGRMIDSFRDNSVSDDKYDGVLKLNYINYVSKSYETILRKAIIDLVSPTLTGILNSLNSTSEPNTDIIKLTHAIENINNLSNIKFTVNLSSKNELLTDNNLVTLVEEKNSKGELVTEQTLTCDISDFKRKLMDKLGEDVRSYIITNVSVSNETGTLDEIITMRSKNYDSMLSATNAPGTILDIIAHEFPDNSDKKTKLIEELMDLLENSIDLNNPNSDISIYINTYIYGIIGEFKKKLENNLENGEKYNEDIHVLYTKYAENHKYDPYSPSEKCALDKFRSDNKSLCDAIINKNNTCLKICRLKTSPVFSS